MKTKIKELRATAEGAVARQNEILTKAAAENNRPLTDAEKADFDAAVKSYDDAMAAIVPLQQVAARAAAVAAVQLPADPVERDVTGVLDDVTRGRNGNTRPDAFVLPASVKPGDTWKVELGCFAWAAARAKSYPNKTAVQHLEDFGFQQLADKSRAADAAIAKEIVETLGRGNAIVARALTSLSGGGGDNMITTPMSTEFIEFLRAESAFLAGGPTVIDMPLGSLVIPGGNVGASGTYHAENADIGYTQATTRKVSMQAKHIAAITAISNYLIDTSPLAVAQIFGDDLARGIAFGMDSAGLRGDGTGDNPAGVLTLVNAAHKYAVINGTGVAPTLAQIDADAKGMLTKLDQSLIGRRRPQWVMCSRVFRYLQFMRDGNGNLVYPGLSLPRPVWYDNLPVIKSDMVPFTLGAGTNESELYLIDFGHVLMGVTRALRLKASVEASYKNAGGTLVSAFSRDETVVRGMASHDFDMRHDKCTVINQALKWGA